MNTRSLSRSLSLMEQVVLHNIQIYETFQEKIIYLENFYDRYFNDVFGKTNYITETYKSRFVNKVIFESRFDFNQHVKKINQYILKAVRFDYLSEQYAQKTTNQKSQAQYIADKANYKGAQISQGSVGYKNTNQQNFVSKASTKFSWDEFFNTLREGLTSTIGQITTSALSLAQPIGPAAVLISWGGLMIYDAWHYFKGKSEYLIKLIEDIINLVSTLLPTLIPGAKQLVRQIGKIGVKSLDEILKLLYNDEIGQALRFTLSGFLTLYEEVIKAMNNGAEWLANKFNIDWPSKVVNDLANALADFRQAVMDKGVTPSGQEVDNIKQDPNMINSKESQKFGIRPYAATIDTSKPTTDLTFKRKS